MVEILDIGNLTIAELLKPELLNLSKSLKSWDRFKGAWLATEIICGSIGCVTLSSIIWFDQYGCTDKYKTVLTRLTSFAAASVLIGKLYCVLKSYCKILLKLFRRNCAFDQWLSLHDAG